MMKQLMLNLTLLISLTIAPLSVWANCQQADLLFKQSQAEGNDPEQQQNWLKQATRLCPNHREAHYQLALLQDNDQHWAEAQWLYQRVIEIDPNFVPAYEKLGDVLMKRGDSRQAAKMFDQCETLAKENAKKRCKDSLDKAEQKIPESSETKITNDLTDQKSIGPRQLKSDLLVRFEYGSYQIKKHDQTWKLCKEIAASVHSLLARKDLKKIRIRIEGHTDSIGSARYNEILSKQRANRVKEVLVNDFNVPEERLEVIGMGEYQPIASNQTRYGRLLNRRVTLVRIDR